ncbi:MAG TPA: pseudouridine synthase [Thermoanaerobaculia bacterium]|nr:pseudouridine synthase [Thermoanaerobaculia bacterium]
MQKPPPGNRPLKTLERVLSKAGLGSRSEARKWIAAARASVNGKVVRDPDAWIDLELDRVTFDGKPVESAEKVYVLLYKPAGFLTTRRDPQGRPTIYDLLPERDRSLAYVGRLDLDTSGLLILTNDTQFAERLSNPDYKVPKTYRVTASRILTDAELQQLRDGIELKDGITRAAIVEPLDDTRFDLTITEGRNRQVRRMVEALGAEVVELVRIAIAAVMIGELRVGATRPLTADEVRSLGG